MLKSIEVIFAGEAEKMNIKGTQHWVDGRKHRRNGFSVSGHRGEADGMRGLAVGGAEHLKL